MENDITVYEFVEIIKEIDNPKIEKYIINLLFNNNVNIKNFLNHFNDQYFNPKNINIVQFFIGDFYRCEDRMKKENFLEYLRFLEKNYSKDRQQISNLFHTIYKNLNI